ncbi:hypothetical protein JXB22_07940 [candidate division WOR-3 bacterium]|nr:hypothetical protein [candidate division WOR-3 bacterium]
MRNKLLLLLLLAIVSNLFAQAPVTGRFWTYGNLTTVVHSHWAYTIMPGIRYEFARDDNGNDAKSVYFYELLTGPVYTFNIRNIAFKLPLWYYYMGFPVSGTEDYYYSHNIELLPTVSYRFDPVIITSRTIFHNTVYASVYDDDADKCGYGLVLRQLVRFDVPMRKGIGLVIGEEPFFGIIEDKEAVPHALGFWEKGFRMNRVYAGLAITVARSLSLSPQYVFETSYGTDGAVTGTNHYFFLTIAYTLKTLK